MYYNNRDVRLEEQPRPIIKQGEILMKVMASGICGSDVMEWYRQKTAPRVLGHEVTGVVSEVGDGVEKHHIGDRIFATHHVPCGECHYCRGGHQTVCDLMKKTNLDPGGFSEYARLAAPNVQLGVLPLPHELSFEEGTFVEPLACVLRGQRFAQIEPSHTVLVIGSGISGLLHIKLAKARNVQRIIAVDVKEYRLKAAERSGADSALDAREDLVDMVKDANQGRLADRVVVCTGAKTASEQALQLVEKGGIILFFSAPRPGEDISLPINYYWLNEISFTSSYGASPNDLAESLQLLQTRKVSVIDMITHRLPLAETGRGFQLVAEADESMKVIIEPNR
jgi:L-iditol 2-dehydrogenase